MEGRRQRWVRPLAQSPVEVSGKGRIGQEAQPPAETADSTTASAGVTIGRGSWQGRFQPGGRQGDRVERVSAARRASLKTGKPAGSPEGDGGSALRRTPETGGFGRRRKVGEGENEIHHRPGKARVGTVKAGTQAACRRRKPAGDRKNQAQPGGSTKGRFYGRFIVELSRMVFVRRRDGRDG
jgi:hypothetical protein